MVRRGGMLLDSWRMHRIEKWKAAGNTTKIADFVRRKKLSDAVLVEGIEALTTENPLRTFNDRLGIIVGLSGILVQKDLSEQVLGTVIRGLDDILGRDELKGEDGGQIKGLIARAINERESISVKEIPEFEVSKSSIMEDNATAIASLFELKASLLKCKDLSEKVRAQIEESLVAGTNISRRWNIQPIAKLLELDCLGDKVVAAGIQVLGEGGHTGMIVSLLEHKDLNENGRPQFETSLLKAIERWGRAGPTEAITKLLEQEVSVKVIEQANASLLQRIDILKNARKIDEIRKLACGIQVHNLIGDGVTEVGTYAQGGPYFWMEAVNSYEVSVKPPPSCKNWNMAVIEELIATVPLKEWHHDQIASLLKRTDLSPQLRKDAEEALPKETSQTGPTDDDFDLER
jgi:hypothetical protein